MSMRDNITIGAKLDGLLGMGSQESEYEGIGSEFVEQTGFMEQMGYDPHNLIKQISFFERGLDILEYGVKNIDKVKKSRAVTVIDDDAKCVFVIYNGPVSVDEQFMVKDLSEYAESFVYVTGLESMAPGAGVSLLIKVMQCVGKLPILIQAGCEYAGDYIMAKEQTIARNRELYMGIGFRDVNRVIGCYEESVAMLYCSDDLYDRIMDQQEDAAR